MNTVENEGEVMSHTNWWEESKHEAVKHVECQSTYCNVCDGGLTICEKCGAMEGALTTHCAGTLLTLDQIEEVYAGKIDFFEGKWVEKRRTVFMYPQDYIK